MGTLTRASTGGGEPREGSVLVQEMTTGFLKGAEAGTTAAKPATLTHKLSKKSDPGNIDGAAAAGKGGDSSKEKAVNATDAGDGNSYSLKKRGKSDRGKYSGSSNENGASKNRMPKRQKRGVDVG